MAERPSETIVVSGGGSVAVASDALFGDAQSLEAVHDELRRAASALVSADAVVGERLLRRADAPLSALDAEREMDHALGVVEAAARRAAAIGFVLRAAAHGYGVADEAAARIAQQLAASLGYSIGRLLPLAAAVVMPALPPVLAALLVAALVSPKQTGALPGAVGAWLADNNRLLTNPVTVALVRAGVMSVDDVIGGALGLPSSVVHALGDEGAGVTGLNTAAGVVAAFGARVGLLVETPVATRVAGTHVGGTVPQGLAQRLDRIPQRVAGADGPRGGHVRIERYSTPGEPDAFAVYVTGTADFSPKAGREAFDLTSNVSGIAELPAGSVRAVQDAMRQAGVTADSPVQFAGFSQGGLVAATLAASGDYNTRGLVAVGAPTGQLTLGEGYPAVLLEHTDDLVPALGGNRVEDHAVLVQREAFADRATPEGVAVPSHDRDEYRRTAQLADAARSATLVETVDELDAFGRGASRVTSTVYVAERVAK